MSFKEELDSFLSQLRQKNVRYTVPSLNYAIADEEIQTQAEQVIGSRLERIDPKTRILHRRINVLDDGKDGYGTALSETGPDEFTLPLRFKLDYVYMSCSLNGTGDRWFSVPIYPRTKLIGVEHGGSRRLYNIIQEAGKVIGYNVKWE